MKILIPSLHYPPVVGGFEVFTQSTAEIISRTDDVFVVTCRVINVPKKETKGRLKIFRTSPSVLKDLAYTKPMFLLGSMIWIVVKSFFLIKKEKIDLIHSQKSAGFASGFMGYILNKLTGVPYVLTIQSADFSIYRPYLNKRFLKTISYRIEKAVFENAAICHSVSQYLGNHLKEHGAKNVVVIPNGIDCIKFTPSSNKKQTRKELGFDTENLIIACGSRLENKNATHDVIEAINYLKNKMCLGKLDIKVVAIGDGPDRPKLEKMIKEYQLEENIFLPGYVSFEDVPKYMAAGDIFIRPSLAEGFGIVFLEAMAAGTMVIATPVGGIVDFLKDRETGIFCEPGNPKDIAEKIKLALTDKELAKHVIEKGLKMARDVYSWDIIAGQVRELYLKVLTMK